MIYNFNFGDHMKFLIFLVLLFLMPPLAHAQLQGTFISAGDSCAGVPEGSTAMTADPTQNRRQIILVCNGSVWEAQRSSFSNQEDCEHGMIITFNASTGGLRCGPPEAPPPTGCDNVGETCLDGTIYAGISPDGDVRMYTTPTDAGLYAWNNANTSGFVHTSIEDCTPDFSESTCSTGRNNTEALAIEDSDQNVAGIQPHLAARYCHCLGKPISDVCASDPTGGAEAYGHDDWYLPSRNELSVLYINLATDFVTPGNSFGFDTTGAWTSGFYWSSSERSINAVWIRRMSDGFEGQFGKQDPLNFRCVRR